MASRSYTYPSKTGNSYKANTDPQEGASPAYIAQVYGIKSVKSTTPVPPKPAKKRKAAAPTPADDGNDDDEFAANAAQDTLAGIGESKPKKPRKKKGEEPEEKRLKRYRVKAPLSYLERLSRVTTQRMFLIDRHRSDSDDGVSEQETFDIAGSTGNVYQVTVGKLPACTCPDAGKGNQCKHIIYVLVNVLKARADLAYQAAFLTTELTEIFANAPVTPQSSSSNATALTTDTGGQRKPIEGDCPICVMEFDSSDKSEDILWCKGACGQNIHRGCFEQWARSKPGPVKCVYCRTPWKGDEDTVKRISKSGKVNQEGYVNVAGELGLSGQRDMRSYHPYWVRRGFGAGYGDYDYE